MDDETKRAPRGEAPETEPVPSAADAQPAGAADTDTDSELSLRYENKRQAAKGGILGLFIGLAIIVPGVSGSAVAIIFRLYEKLLYALGHIFRRFKPCILFLLPILAGAAVGLILGFFGVRELMNLLPFAVVALFAGLMLGSFPAVTDQLKGARPTVPRVLLFVLGLAVPVAVSVFSTLFVENGNSLESVGIWHYLLFLLLGFIVAVTQLVPGLSATALLMMFGWFTPLLNSVSLTYWRANPQVFLVYVCLIVGFVAGLVTVSRLLSQLMERRRTPTFCTVAGLSLGSILTMFFNPDIYAVYLDWSAGGPMGRDLGLGVALFAAGLALACFFVRYERKKGNPSAANEK